MAVSEDTTAVDGGRRRAVGLALGPGMLLACWAWSALSGADLDMLLALGTALWAATWWFTEAVPIAVAALVPAVVLPAAGVLEPDAAWAPYADGVVLLFLGGFLVALAIERHGLHRRVALLTLAAAGRGPRSLLAAVMAVTAVLSAWISNTAAAMLLLPIVLAVVAHEERAEPGEASTRLAQALLLGVAYAATLGGLATLIGTPPNALLASLAGDLAGVEIGFAQWMLFAMPLSLFLLVVAWLLLALVVFRLPARFASGDHAREEARSQLHDLGRLDTAERRVALLFGSVAAAWVLRPFIEDHLPFTLDDTIIALTAGILAFVIPRGGAGADGREPLLAWGDTRDLPWGVLLLLGGGLSLAAAFTASGLGERVGEAIAGLDGLDDWLVILITVAVSVVVTEVASNTASAAALLPIAAAAGVAAGIDPLVMMAAVALGSTTGFMMPAGTPPMAMAFGTGRLPMPLVVRAGLLMDLACIAAVTLGVATGVELVFG